MSMVRFNDKNEVIHKEIHRAILVGLQTDKDISYFMDELWGLAKAGGIEVVGEMVQVRERPTPATFIGSGKVKELAEMCINMEVNMVVFNNELTGIQFRNLEEKLGVCIIDRTILILDIFADRAVSKEGKLQVELAQLEYRLPRLTGFGRSLSRLGGGIGTRGPGEKKLETDRRHIRLRMNEIKKEIKEIKNHRQIQRAQREKSGIPLVALVGYTNSGKSAVMNRFLHNALNEDKAVTEKDMLFATLDTFHRYIKLDSNHEFILIDTVGFVSNLPHSLINAFKATLEEVVYADLLLHIVDASYPNSDFHIQVTDQVLAEIGSRYKEKIIVYNKIDLIPGQDKTAFEGKNHICISAKYGENFDALEQMIREKLYGDRVKASLLIPYGRGEITSDICERYKVEKTEYREKGTYMEVKLSLIDYKRLEKYQIK